jgi:endonuclease VIII
MPEGDTIHRAATRLGAVLASQVIERATSRWLGDATNSLPGRQIKEVQARGKHLLIMLDDDRAIHSHMGMTGSWHIYRPGEPWQKPAHRAALSLECPDACVVCFTPKLLELLTATRLRRHDYLNRLGPDLLAGPPADNTVLARFRQCNDLPIGQVIMNQTVISGIGNVYKSELLFHFQLHPQTLVRQIEDQQLLQLTTKASDMMSQNLDGRPRTTRYALDGGRFYVYGRSGKPCYSCGTPIELIRQGDAGRSTYFCPRCQLLGEASFGPVSSNFDLGQ